MWGRKEPGVAFFPPHGALSACYHSFNAKTKKPQGPPRVEKGVSSQISHERGMHHAPPRSITDFRKSTAREQEKTNFFKVPLKCLLTV